MAGTITISSSYGADGVAIGRDVAERLGLEFYDRAIPVAVARELSVDPNEALAKDWQAPGRMERVLAAFASVSMPFGMPFSEAELYADPGKFRRATEDVLREVADGKGGVILGRAAMVILADRPDVLCVRLDGPVEARIRRVVDRGEVDEDTARREQKATDDARESYVQTFYGLSQNNDSLYHLRLDATAFSRALCVEAILLAARERPGLDARPSTG